MKRLQQLAGMKLSRTTPYHPQGNGQAERWNRPILSVLQTLTESQKANWKDHVDKVVHTIVLEMMLHGIHLFISCMEDLHICRLILCLELIQTMR